jgi:hypothetical protein
LGKEQAAELLAALRELRKRREGATAGGMAVRELYVSRLPHAMDFAAAVISTGTGSEEWRDDAGLWTAQ